MGQQHRTDNVAHIDIRLALPAVAQDAQLGRILSQPTPDEVEADAMRLPAADHVAEAKGAAAQASNI